MAKRQVSCTEQDALSLSDSNFITHINKTTHNEYLDHQSVRASILLVEDQPLIYKVHRHILNALGYSVVRSITGQSAIAAVKSHHFCCILLDINLPDMNGIEVAQRLRQLSHLNEIPIIAVTMEDELIKPECFAAGMNDFIKKPATLTTFKTTINKWV